MLIIAWCARNLLNNAFERPDRTTEEFNQDVLKGRQMQLFARTNGPPEVSVARQRENEASAVESRRPVAAIDRSSKEQHTAHDEHDVIRCAEHIVRQAVVLWTAHTVVKRDQGFQLRRRQVGDRCERVPTWKSTTAAWDARAAADVAYQRSYARCRASPTSCACPRHAENSVETFGVHCHCVSSHCYQHAVKRVADHRPQRDIIEQPEFRNHWCAQTGDCNKVGPGWNKYLSQTEARMQLHLPRRGRKT